MLTGHMMQHGLSDSRHFRAAVLIRIAVHPVQPGFAGKLRVVLETLFQTQDEMDVRVLYFTFRKIVVLTDRMAE